MAGSRFGGLIWGRLAAAARRDPALIVVAGVFLAGLGLRLWFLVALRPAFLGFTDAGGYIGTAQGLADSPVRPVGYPIFFKGLHALTANLTWTIVVQHALGLASATMLYLATLRITRSRLGRPGTGGVCSLRRASSS